MQKIAADQNINKVSEKQLVEAFSKEYEQAMAEQLDQGYQIYLIDLIEDLKFIDNKKMASLFDNVDQILQSRG